MKLIGYEIPQTLTATNHKSRLKNCTSWPARHLDFDFDFDFDDTRFRSFQSQDHVQVLKTETDWPRWYGDGANQIICDKNWNWPRWGQTDH